MSRKKSGRVIERLRRRFPDQEWSYDSIWVRWNTTEGWYVQPYCSPGVGDDTDYRRSDTHEVVLHTLLSFPEGLFS